MRLCDEKEIYMLEEFKREANLGKFQIISDQNGSIGGDKTYPEPFVYF
jgi:hypothetical protein